PPWTSFVLRLDVPTPKSPRSRRSTAYPRAAASTATPAPVAPPPTTTTSHAARRSVARRSISVRFIGDSGFSGRESSDCSLLLHGPDGGVSGPPPTTAGVRRRPPESGITGDRLLLAALARLLRRRVAVRWAD